MTSRNWNVVVVFEIIWPLICVSFISSCLVSFGEVHSGEAESHKIKDKVQGEADRILPPPLGAFESKQLHIGAILQRYHLASGPVFCVSSNANL